MPTLPTSRHFELTQLAGGVYAAIAAEGGAAYSNAGIIDMGNHTLIFDTFDTPQAGQDLRAAAERLTGSPVTHVVNSHWHGDHWSGNQAFAHAAIIATEETLARMREQAEEIKASIQDPSGLEEMLRQNQERLKRETDERRRASLTASSTRLRHTLEALPTFAVCLPNMTFDTRLVFHGARRRVEVLSWGVGHTSSDALLILPVERIAFAGDLVFSQCQPFMPSCEPQAWVTQLEKMEQSDIRTFVPGHGPLAAKADLALQRQYIVMLQETVARAVEAGRPVEEIVQQPLPAPFDAWLLRGIARLEANVDFLYRRLSGKRSQ